MARRSRDLFHNLPAHARILLIRLRSMGDCILLTSPLRALKEEFPGFRISVLAEPRFAACFDGNPDVDEVLVTSEKKYRTMARLFLRSFHAVVNLHGGPTSLAFSCAAWGRRIGREDYQYARLYSRVIPRPAEELHTVAETMRWFRWLGLRAKLAPPLRYTHHAEEAEWVRQIMRNRAYVVIHPAASMETKQWSTEGFAAIGKLLSEAGWCTVLTCGPGEESAVGAIAAKLPASVILFGLTTAQLAEVIRGAKLYVGNDSGPMHLAAAVRTPTVAVWGSSNRERWRPWAVPHRVVQNPFDCNPCPGYRCEIYDTPRCIESVTVRQVSDAVGQLLLETGAPLPSPVTPLNT